MKSNTLARKRQEDGPPKPFTFESKHGWWPPRIKWEDRWYTVLGAKKIYVDPNRGTIFYELELKLVNMPGPRQVRA